MCDSAGALADQLLPDSVWDGAKKNFDRIQKWLKFSARIIFGRRKFDRVADLREQLRFMTPRKMTEARQTEALTHKVLRRGEPDSLANLFVQCRDTRGRCARQDGLLRLLRPRTEAGDGVSCTVLKHCAKRYRLVLPI